MLPSGELWDGLRAGQDGAISQFGADDAFPIGDIDDILPGLIEGRERVYYALGANPEFDRHLMEWINVIRSKARQGAQPPNEFVALDHLLHDMRLYKSAAEVKVMKEAAEISAAAHVRAMQTARPGLSEYHLEAELDYEFRKGGAKMPAYGSIVAAGRNACILHYRENDAVLKDGDLVLIDMGLVYKGYCSDMTRTFVAGKPDQTYLDRHRLVRRAMLAGIGAIRAGVTGAEVDKASRQVLADAGYGEAFGAAVKLFAESSDKMMNTLQRIEAGLGKSLTRSDEQLAYYVAQAREIIDHSMLSQQEIISQIRQLGRAGENA